MTLSEELLWRGFINQTTLDDPRQLDEKSRTFYHGFDASVDSLTVGNLAGLMFDKTLMRHGHKAIVLAGGATSLIGDPGGKEAERPLQDEAVIAANIDGVVNQMHRVLSGFEFTLVNNIDWTKSMSVLTFMRDIGKHFGMSTLVQRDYIARRLGDGGSGISYTEFSYGLLQGMDFLHLFDEYECTLQVGSSDQWSNCLGGVDLIRKARGHEVHVLTHPLVIDKTTGKKFGKSEAGAIWLDEQKTSAYQFYQFWLNVDDESVVEYLKIFTTLDKPAVDAIRQQLAAAPSERHAQKRLAQEVTRLVHGDERLKAVEEVTAVLFDGRPVGDLSDSALGQLAAEIPVTAPGSITEVLMAAGVAGSLSEARRLLAGGGVSVDGVKANDATRVEGLALVKKGRNSFILVRG